MVGVNNILDVLFPSLVVKLIGEFYYDEASATNDAIFELFDGFISMFRYAKIFCRAYGFEFSKNIMVMIEDTQFGFSKNSRYHYSHSIDETHYRQKVQMWVGEVDDPDPDLKDILSFRNWMICKSYANARALAFSPFQTKIRFWCSACREGPSSAPDYTVADQIDNGQIATACIKHR